MKVSKTVDFWAWALIYGGALLGTLGWFLQPSSAVVGASALIAGGFAFAAGVVLIIVRSRMKDAP